MAHLSDEQKKDYLKKGLGEIRAWYNDEPPNGVNPKPGDAIGPTENMISAIIANRQRQAEWKSAEGTLGGKGLPTFEAWIENVRKDFQSLVVGLKEVDQCLEEYSNAAAMQGNRTNSFNCGAPLRNGKACGGSTSSIKINLKYMTKYGVTSNILKEVINEIKPVQLSTTASTGDSHGMTWIKKTGYKLSDGKEQVMRCHFYFPGLSA